MRPWLPPTAFAAHLATGSAVILAHGLVGAGSLFTAIYMTASMLLLGACGRWRETRLVGADLAFLAFVLCTGLSLGIRGFADSRQAVLLGFSIVAYPAARGMVSFVPDRVFIGILGCILVLATIATALALGEQWASPHGKPLVFGQFDHAPAQFTFLLGLIVIVAACSNLPLLPILALLAMPAAIFAASQTRLTFVAILISLCLVGVLAPKAAIKRVGSIAAVLVACVLAGGMSRGSVTAQFMRYVGDGLMSTEPASRTASITTAAIKPASQSNAGPTQTASATVEITGQIPQPTVTKVCPKVDKYNSIAIRKQLYNEALMLLPSAGLFGIGLDRFAASSCVAGASPHNSILQAGVELGIPAGLILGLLIIIVARCLLARSANGEARLALGVLTFVLLLSMGHGRISGDGILFAALGYGAAVASRKPDDGISTRGALLESES